MDLALTTNAPAGGFDIALSSADLAADRGLRSAILISLFTDRRAESDDILPDGTNNRRGWWADAWPRIAGDSIGSRLWLLGREKELTDTLRRAEEYAEEALAWLVEDGVASSVRVTAERVRAGLLGLQVHVERPGAERWQATWEYELGRA